MYTYLYSPLAAIEDSWMPSFGTYFERYPHVRDSFGTVAAIMMPSSNTDLLLGGNIMWGRTADDIEVR